ncbi:MAG: ion transporter [Desulfatiglans sp.]|nr:ion transporter [Desulfatiglans sp.]
MRSEDKQGKRKDSPLSDMDPINGIRRTIQFYLIDCRTPVGKIIDILIILLNLVICAIFVIDTYDISEDTRSILWKTEVIIIAFFIVEYAARLYGARNRRKQLMDIYSIIDLIAILPTLSLLMLPVIGVSIDLGLIREIRIFRVFRIFRFLRFTADPHFFFGTITIKVLQIVRLFLTILMIFFISSGLFLYVERDINQHVATFGDAFYFTVVTLTTVGFGDITPISEPGKWVTVLMIISGIILIPWQVSRLIREWIHLATKKETVCRRCGLRYHDRDASHCKACGHIIYQEYDGD